MKLTLTFLVEKKKNATLGLMQKKFSFNHIYFISFFLFICLLSFLSIPLTQKGLLFFAEAFFQSFIETQLFICATLWIEKKHPLFSKAWAILLLLLPLLYLINFFLLSLMDAPLSHGWNIFLGQGLGKFFVSLRAANIHTPLLIVISIALISLPVFALLVDRWTNYLSKKKPLRVTPALFVHLFFGMVFFLLLTDFSLSRNLAPSFHQRWEKRLPWGSTLFSPKPFYLHALSSPIRPPPCNQHLPSIEKKTHLPNIYLFVIESLRKDAITVQTAPHLFDFQKQNTSLPLTFSSGNFSPISWFSIFHALFPIYWRESLGNQGSKALLLLKQLGYKIHLFSSAELEYFHMDESIFGKEHLLADEYLPIAQELQPPKRDEIAFELLRSSLVEKEETEGNLFILFLDSTHSEYSWPQNFPASFVPFSTSIPYLILSQNHSSLPLVKNRYYNALHYIDYLFGNWIHLLQEKNLFTSSIIAFTADHGEEFFEEGALFHGTHLNNPQTSVPIFYHFPPHNLKIQTEMTSHIDIFPTILHFLTQKTFSDFFDGVSLFAPHSWPYVLTVHQNGGDTPYIFSLLYHQARCIGQLDKETFHSKKFEILSLKNLQDEDIEKNDFEFLTAQFSIAIDALLQKR